MAGNKFYRIKKIKKDKKEMFFPQKKGTLGWRNVYYDLYFETLDGATGFLDDYTTPQKTTTEYIEYDNLIAKPKFDLTSKIYHILFGDF
jgi:hypothetical protein